MVAEKRGREKTKTEMGERHHGYVWDDGGSKQSGGGHTSILQRRPDENMLREEIELV